MDDPRSADDARASYRSYRKKWRKMRIPFDRVLADCEGLLRKEQRAKETARRIAIENDRLLDLLLDINESPQVPPERRIDLRLDGDDPELHKLPRRLEALDRGNTNFDDVVTWVRNYPRQYASPFDEICPPPRSPTPPPTPPACASSLRRALESAPHLSYAETRVSAPHLLADVEPDDAADELDAPFPNFLTPDDVDNYMWEIDTRLSAPSIGGPNTGVVVPPPDALPTLAPLAATMATLKDDSGVVHSSRLDKDPDAHVPTAASGGVFPPPMAVRNPHSQQRWLKLHHPEIFLQNDGGAKDKDDHPPPADAHEPGAGKRLRHDDHHDDDAHGSSSSGHGTAKVPGGRPPTKRSRAGHRAGQHPSAAADREEAEQYEYIFEDMSRSHAGAPAFSKRKRVDDDPGYRPKGGASRPAKKKRKSDPETSSAASKKTTRKDGPSRAKSKAKGSGANDTPLDDEAGGVVGEPEDVPMAGAGDLDPAAAATTAAAARRRTGDSTETASSHGEASRGIEAT